MGNRNLTKEAQLVLDILRERNGDKKPPSIDTFPLEDINWPLLIKMLRYHKLIPFSYLFFKHSSFTLSKETKDIFEKKYNFVLSRNIRFQEEFLRLYRIFTKEGIGIVPIKGLALLADLYNQYPVRPMTDMDILAKEEELEKAEGILENSGYKKHLGKGSYSYWRGQNCNIPFKKEKEDWLLELHFALDLKRHSWSILPDLWKRIQPFDINGTKIKLLSPEDTLFSLALHQRRFGAPLCLKNTLDIALLLHKYKDKFDWRYVLEEAKKGEMRLTIFFVLLQAEFLQKTQISPLVWKELRVPDWKRKLIKRLIEKDTFSSKPFSRLKHIYLKTHFLLYDSLWEPINYILHITREEFAKFYNLTLYAPKTETLYKMRFLYLPWRLILDNLKKLPFND